MTAYGQTYTVGSGFDVANRKTSITYPDGTLMERAYSPRDKLAEIKYASSVVDTRTYDNGGRLATSLYGKGIGTTWSYRNDDLVASITRTNLTGADFTYTYDANKNKTLEAISGVMAPYGFDSTGYDSKDRLTAWNRTDGNLNLAWNLSKEGDWISFTENTVVQPRTHSPVHELDGIDTTPLTYDAKGNLATNANGQSYSWDFDNRLASATVPVDATEGIEGTHTYTYDALGRRVSKSVSAGGNVETTVFVCVVHPLEHSPSAGQVVAEYEGGVAATTPQREFVYASYIDEPVLLVDEPATTAQVYYYHANSLHSVAALTDDLGAAAERYAYAAYGKPLILAADGTTMRTESLIGNPYAFTARRHEDETALHYYRARYYDVSQGRFLGRDPIGFNGRRWNTYEYVGSRPASAVDPTGHFVVPLLCAIANGAFTLNTEHPNAGDAWKHCVIACRMTRNCGVLTAKTAFGMKEVLDGLEGDPPSDIIDDMIANHVCMPIESRIPITGFCTMQLTRWIRSSCEDCCTSRLGYNRTQVFF